MSEHARPTPGELEILGVLWSIGPATVRQVYTALEARKPAGYTTVLKLMQIMAEKGLLTRDERDRAHVYEPVMGKEAMQTNLVDDLLEKAFGGSASQLVQRALEARKMTKAEMAEIRAMVEQAERRRR
jgi:predicted transcriptional regulator